MNRTLYSGFRFNHHSEGSGYDALVPAGAPYVCGNRLPWTQYHESSLRRRANLLLTDLLTLVRGLRYDTIHFIYPENSAYVAPLVLSMLGKRIVFTVHLPEDMWLGPTGSPFRALKQRGFRRADVVITLSSAQETLYRARLPGRTVRFVPHGMCFDARSPSDVELEARRSDPELVLVGRNFRDFDLLERIWASRGQRSVRCNLVGMDAELRQRFAGLPGMVCHPRLDARRYEQLLSRCVAMLLPLNFATANNAMLEAYRAYLPVIATDIPGVSDYVVDHDLLFSDAPGFWRCWDALRALEAAEYRRRCHVLQERARERFSWLRVLQLIQAVNSSRE